MTGADLLTQGLVYLAAAVVAVPVAKRLGLGSVLGYLAAGALIGPFGLHLVGAERADVLHFAEFGVVLMLFLVGLELEPALLWRLRGSVFGLGGLQVALTAALVAAAAALAGLSWPAGVAVGLILALSSTAIALQSLDEKGRLKTEGGQRAFSVLLFQDIAVIPILALLPLLAPRGAAGEDTAAGAGAHGALAGQPGWVQALAVLGAVAAVVLAGRFLVRPLLRAAARTRLREMFTASSLLLVVGIAVLMREVGLSPALGTFLAGVVLANSEYRHELVADIEPFKGLLLGLFFIAVGASIDFGLVAARPGLLAALVAGVVLLKLLVLLGLGRAFGLAAAPAVLLAASLAQVGEFAFVLIGFAAQLGVLRPAVAGPLVAVVALTMALSPVVEIAADRLVLPRLGPRAAPAREPDPIDERNAVIVAGFGRFGQVVARLLRAQSRTPTGSSCCAGSGCGPTTATPRAWTSCTPPARRTRGCSCSPSTTRRSGSSWCAPRGGTSRSSRSSRAPRTSATRTNCSTRA